MPKKVAKDNDENVDYGPYDMNDSEEEEAGQNITPKNAVKTTTKTKNSAQKAAEKEAEDKKREMRAAIDAKMAAVLTPEEMEFRAQEEADKEKALAKKLRGPQTSSKTHQTNLDEAKVAIEETRSISRPSTMVSIMSCTCLCFIAMSGSRFLLMQMRSSRSSRRGSLSRRKHSD